MATHSNDDNCNNRQRRTTLNDKQHTQHAPHSKQEATPTMCLLLSIFVLFLKTNDIVCFGFIFVVLFLLIVVVLFLLLIVVCIRKQTMNTTNINNNSSDS